MAVTQYKTQTPAQYRTDTMYVRANGTRAEAGMVEVPRYSQPDASGIKLSREKRLALAVARAIESFVDDDYTTLYEGTEWVVAYDGSEYVVEYEDNPAFAGVWNPMEDDE